MSGDTLLETTLRTLYISGFAIAMASSWSIPLALLIVEKRVTLLKRVAEALTGMPTVLVGLLVYMLLCGRCPLGWAGLLYTPFAISLGEALLVTPVYVSFLVNTLEERYIALYEMGMALSGDPLRSRLFALKHSIGGLLSSLLSSFSRASGELGVALLVGGNIEGYTRTLATSIALYVEMGEFERAIYYGAMLAGIMLTFGVAAWLAERYGARS